MLTLFFRVNDNIVRHYMIMFDILVMLDCDFSVVKRTVSLVPIEPARI